MSPLRNPKHERFAQEIAAGAATKVAYRRAGFKGKGNSCYVGGSRLLKNDKIQARIVEMRAAAAKRVVEKIEVTTIRVLEELAAIGFANIADYLSLDDEGKPTFDLSALDRRRCAGIAEIMVEKGKDGTVRTRLKLANKLGALAKLLEYTMAMDELARQNKPNASAAQQPASQKPFDTAEMLRRYGVPGKKEEVN